MLRVLASALLADIVTGAGATKPVLRIAGSSTVLPVANAWAAHLGSEYTFEVAGGGSSSGAQRVCYPPDHEAHVDIGDMSRDWKTTEAEQLDDDYTFECKASKNRVTQIAVGVDGLAVVVAKNGEAHNCITNPEMGGLTLAALRWMFTDLSDSEFEEAGASLASVVPNDNGDGIKEWSDLNAACSPTPINLYGPGNQSGTHDFFGEVVLDKDRFGDTEYFPTCSDDGHQLEQLNSSAAVEFIRANRTANCYVPSEDDEKIMEWVLADTGGIAYFGFAYYSRFSAALTVVRIASDKVNGPKDTADAMIAPTSYTITDGSYAVFTRSLFMNVYTAQWPIAKAFMNFGFSDTGQALVTSVGYVAPNAALRTKMLQRIAEMGNSSADYKSFPPAMCWNGTRLQAKQFKNKFGRVKTAYSCVPCIKGTSKESNEAAGCIVCPAGRYADEEGTSSCRFCDEGRYSAPAAATCMECGRNKMARGKGNPSCETCAPGFYTASPGESACRRCPKGTYKQPGNVSCVACPPGFMTDHTAAVSPRACMCAPGSFLPEVGGACLVCPQGMACPFGSAAANLANWAQEAGDCPAVDFTEAPEQAFPLVERGYMTLSSDPMRVYKCNIIGACPGGCPGSCAFARDTAAIACGLCSGDAYEAGDACEKCGSFGTAPFLLTGFVAVTALGVMTFVVNRDLHMQTQSQLLVVVAAGLMFTSIQSLGIFNQMAIEWFEPVKTLLSFMTVMSFDLKVLKIGCVLGSHPVVEYLCRQLVVLVVPPSVLAAALLKKSWMPQSRVSVDFVNAVGTVLQAFFIAILTSGAMPLICYQHPNGSGYSIAAEPSIRCFEDASHGAMVAIGVTAMMLVPVPFLAFTIYGTWKYPSFIAGRTSPDNYLQFESFRFLFFRYRPRRYYYGIIFLMKNLAICLVPVVVRNDTPVQLMLMSVILASFVLVQQRLNPWRTEMLNIGDAILSLALILLLTLGAMATDLSPEMASISVLGSILFSVFVALILGAVGCYVAQRFRPDPWYGYFICHHKAQAGAQARLLKQMLQQRTGKTVFIDSDNLRELDKLFDIVKGNLEHLVVFLTKDILTRAWCVGEITTAFKTRKVKVSVLLAESFVSPTEEQLLDLETYLDLSSTSLLEYGITMEDVAAAFRQLLSPETPCIKMQPELKGMSRFESLISGLLNEKQSKSEVAPSNIPWTEGMLVVSSDPYHDEATAATGILLNKIQEQVFTMVTQGTCILADCIQDYEAMSFVTLYAHVVVVVLSPKTLETLEQLIVIVAAMLHDTGTNSSEGVPVVIPLALDNFCFPDDSYYESQLPRIWTFPNVNIAEAKIRAFFKRIAVPFSTHASDRMINTQAQEVVTRIPVRSSKESTTKGSEGLIDLLSPRDCFAEATDLFRI